MKLSFDVMLVVVTDIEFECVKKVFKERNRTLFTPIKNAKIPSYNLGIIGGNTTCLVRSGMAASGPDGSSKCTQYAVEEFSPSFALMIGIAWGANSTQQSIGDVLVANYLVPFDHQKIKNGEIVLRGARPPAATHIINTCNFVKSNQHFDFNVTISPILSGEKLIDDKHYKETLLKLVPNAAGGEMEGAGFSSACDQTPWGVIKAICDWAENKDVPDKDSHQRTAATNAARFTFELLCRNKFQRANGSSITTHRSDHDEPTNESRYKTNYERIRSAYEARKESIDFVEKSIHAFESFLERRIRLDLLDETICAMIAHQLIEDYSQFGQEILGTNDSERVEIPEKFNRVYPNTVNSYIRDVISIISNPQRPDTFEINATDASIANAAKFIIKRSIRNKSFINENTLVGPEVHAAYVLGRVRTTQARNGAQDTLRAFEKTIEDTIETTDSSTDQSRYLRLMRRTALLSQAMLGSDEAAERYMRLLKNSYEETDVNSGFHLEYYLDQPFDVRMPLCSRDSGGNADNTVRTLTRSLSNQITDRRKLASNPIVLIEMYTLSSIIARRINSEKWNHYAQSSLPVLAQAAELIDDEDINIFVSTLIDANSGGNTFASREIGRFFAAKNAPRNGWVIRKVDYPETVGSHTASAIWLCNLIPRSTGEIDIERIRRMLEIHDLAEGITGDIAEPNRTNSQDQEERAHMRRLSWLGLYTNPVLDFFEIYSLYDEFKNKLTVESKIANDIDRIDIVMQCNSLLKTNASIDRAAIARLSEDASKKVATEQGKHLLELARDFQIHSQESFQMTPNCGVKNYFFRIEKVTPRTAR